MKYFVQATVLSTLFLAQNAYAYLDPGTASLIIQGLIAGIASAVSLCALYWAKVKNFFSKNSNDSSVDEPEDDTEK